MDVHVIKTNDKPNVLFPSILCRSGVSMVPTASGALKCEPVFDLITERVKTVSCKTFPF